jgi:hypothetical protein
MNEENENLQSGIKPKGNGMEDLFSVPSSTDNDMRIDFLLEPPEDEGDLSDLTTVSDEDIMGYKPKGKNEELEEEFPGAPANYNVQPNQQYRINPTLAKPTVRKLPMPITLRGVQQ